MSSITNTHQTNDSAATSSSKQTDNQSTLSSAQEKVHTAAGASFESTSPPSPSISGRASHLSINNTEEQPQDKTSQSKSKKDIDEREPALPEFDAEKSKKTNESKRSESSAKPEDDNESDEKFFESKEPTPRSDGNIPKEPGNAEDELSPLGQKLVDNYNRLAAKATQITDYVSSQMPKTVGAMPDPFWVFRAGWEACKTHFIKPKADPLLQIKNDLQAAIETDNIERLAKNLSSVRPEIRRYLLNTLLPNQELPLHYCVRLKRTKLALLLLIRTVADPTRRDLQKQTAFDHAECTDQMELYKQMRYYHILEKYGDACLIRHPQTGQVFVNPETKEPYFDNAKWEKIQEALAKEFEKTPTIDPLNVSYYEWISVISSIAIRAYSMSGYSPLDNSWVESLGKMGSIFEAYSVLENIGSMQFYLMLASMINYQPIQTFVTVIRTGIIGLSLIHTLKVAKDNYKFRPLDTIKKVTVKSFNAYNVFSKFFEPYQKRILEGQAYEDRHKKCKQWTVSIKDFYANNKAQDSSADINEADKMDSNTQQAESLLKEMYRENCAGYSTPPDNIQKYYTTLGLTHEATRQEIKNAFRQLSRENHPDKSSDPLAHALFLEINEAYEMLSTYILTDQVGVFE